MGDTQNYAEKFMKKGTDSLERRKSSFYITSPIEGIGFTSDAPHTLPTGKYLVLEPDTRDRTRSIVFNTTNHRLYSLPSKLLS